MEYNPNALEGYGGIPNDNSLVFINNIKVGTLYLLYTEPLEVVSGKVKGREQMV